MTSLRHRTKLVPTSSSDNLLPVHHNDKTNNSRSWKRTSSKRRVRVIRCLLIGGAVAVIFVFGVLTFAYRVLSVTDPSTEQEENPKGVIAKLRERLRRDQEHEKHKNRRKYQTGKDLLEHLKHKKDPITTQNISNSNNMLPSPSEHDSPLKRKEDVEESLKEQEEMIQRIDQGEKLPPKPLQQPRPHHEPKEHSLEYLENAAKEKRDNIPLGEEVSIHKLNHPSPKETRHITECVSLISYGHDTKKRVIQLSANMMNDNYCDCADGIDEPHTSACAHVLVNQRAFQCGSDNVWIDASRVRDGIRDCPNGADEMLT